MEICQALSVGPRTTSTRSMDGHLRVNTLFISANVRKAVQEGRADFTPVLLSEFPLLFKNNVLPVDVALIHVSPAGRARLLLAGRGGGPDQVAGRIGQDHHRRSE